ncbi:MAG: cytochrome ubiquinol oxidase subunit I, partial [Deltaproteobacteria bacterium]|nr:cytochrome ubiquinol oxidase subunit I [Deltaproteobacteria bacterium]
VVAVLGAVAANQLGWVTAEVGRQPWAVPPTVLRDAQGQFLRDAQGLLQYRLEEGLLTRVAVSESVKADAVLASMVMFGFIYLLLGAIWLYVLNHKIQIGPEPAPVVPGRTSALGLREAAAGLTLHGESMTEAKEPGSPPTPEPPSGDQGQGQGG